MDCKKEIENRVEFIKQIVSSAHAKGIVYGNSGGKDSALVGILSKMACENTTGILLPCDSQRNYTLDTEDALKVAKQFNIKTLTVDLTPAKKAMEKCLREAFTLTQEAASNINPRLRMAALYAFARENGCLVAGTGNACEAYVGYFTKWGDGAHDFNPIGDMMVDEIYELLTYLNAPESVITKAPSAALKEGQTDEGDLGVTYAEISAYLREGPNAVSEKTRATIEKMHMASEHKLNPIPVYKRK